MASIAHALAFYPLYLLKEDITVKILSVDKDIALTVAAIDPAVITDPALAVSFTVPGQTAVHVIDIPAQVGRTATQLADAVAAVVAPVVRVGDVLIYVGRQIPDPVEVGNTQSNALVNVVTEIGGNQPALLTGLAGFIAGRI